MCILIKTSITPRLETIFMSMMKESSRSCGRRAPTRVRRAGSGGVMGGDKDLELQAGRLASTAAQRAFCTNGTLSIHTCTWQPMQLTSQARGPVIPHACGRTAVAWPASLVQHSGN